MAVLSGNNTLHWCRNCMGRFDTEEILKCNKLYYLRVDTTVQVLLLPAANRKVKFENEPYAYPPFYQFYTIVRHH